MNVTATTLDDRRHQMNGVQAYHTLAPGPTKQPYYPAIRFVEQHKDIPANQVRHMNFFNNARAY